METFRLASSSSPMALAQTARVGNRIAARLEPLRVVEIFVETPLDPGRQVERIAERVRDEGADAGICAASRLGGSLPHGVIVAALLRDREPHYRCVSPERPSLDHLPRHARVVTCDAVCRAQVLHRLPRLQADLAAPSWEIFAGLRHHGWDAACLPPEIFDVGSLAGLASERIDAEEVVPSVGQGVAAILARADDTRVRERLARLNDVDLEIAFRAERAFLAGLADMPLDSVATARAVRTGWWVEMTGVVAQRDGRWLARLAGRLSAESAEAEARQLAASCRERAAREAAPREVLVR
jgi:hydroxymethylbilane synthase